MEIYILTPQMDTRLLLYIWPMETGMTLQTLPYCLKISLLISLLYIIYIKKSSYG
jgi:hypothetical protein